MLGLGLLQTHPGALLGDVLDISLSFSPNTVSANSQNLARQSPVMCVVQNNKDPKAEILNP